MISKKALLVAMGLAFAIPGTSDATSAQDLLAQLSAMDEEQDTELQEAEALTKQKEENAKKAAAELEQQKKDLQKALNQATLAEKNKLTKQYENLVAARKNQTNATNELVDQRRALIKKQLDTYAKRAKVINETKQHLAGTYSV